MKKNHLFILGAAFVFAIGAAFVPKAATAISAKKSVTVYATTSCTTTTSCEPGTGDICGYDLTLCPSGAVRRNN